VKLEQRVLCVSELSFYHKWWTHSLVVEEVEVEVEVLMASSCINFFLSANYAQTSCL